MANKNGRLFAIWGNNPDAQTSKMYKIGAIKSVDGTEIPYGYIRNSQGVEYKGNLYNILERDSNWKLV